MKKAVLTLVFMALCLLLSAQVPESFSYQVVVRDGTSNNPLTNQDVSFRMSILKGSSSGESQYSELHSANTGALGIVNLVIGNGTGKVGSISSIDWGADSYFLKIELDKGDAIFVDMGTTQLLSVPYAMHAKTTETFSETDPVFTAHPSNGISGTDITNWNTAFGWDNHALAGYIPGSRTLTINGTAYDLTADRSWSVGTLTSVGLSMPAIFSVSGSPVTGSGTLSAELVSQSANLVFASPSGSAGAPTFRTLDATDIPDLDWSKITTGKPTTLGGYGITDGVNTSGDQTIGGTKTFSNTIVAGNGVNANSNTISNVADPTSTQDAATKAYVDLLLARIEILELTNEGFTDSRDGNIYHGVKIGNQVWMAENLKYLPSVVGPATGSNTTSYYYVYDYNNILVNEAKATANYITYGVLYNWPAAMNGAASSTANPSGVQGVCPTGWHLPSDSEWTELTNYLGGGMEVAGAKLMEIGTNHWISPNTWATNESGFTALPGGYRYESGLFGTIHTDGHWWCATEKEPDWVWNRCMKYNDSRVYKMNYTKELGMSVRCVKDQ